MISNRSWRRRVVGATAASALIAIGVSACGSGGSGSAAASSGGPAASAPAAAGSSASASTAPAAPTGGPTSAGSHAQQVAFMSYASSSSFDATVGALKKSAGMNLKGAHAFFVGNPTKGKMFFSTDPAIGSVVPLRMYVWADSSGKAHVGYFDPAGLFKAVNPKMASAGQQMAKAAAMIAKGATK